MAAAASPDPHPLAGLLTVMWHYVRDPEEQPRVGAGAVSPAAFDAQLDLIAAHRTVVGWPAVAAALDGGPALPPNAALLTFDDGLVDHARMVAPRLVERGWSGVFFAMARAPGESLTVGHAIHVLLGALGEEGLRTAVEDALPRPRARDFAALRQRAEADGFDAIDVLKRPLQRDLLDVVDPILESLVERHGGPSGEIADALHLKPGDIDAMRAAGLTIGGHSRRHLWFDHEPPARVDAEIAASVRLLATEPRPWAFAYPYGAASAASATILNEAGFAAAFHAAPRRARDRYDLARVDAEDPAFGSIVARSRR